MRAIFSMPCSRAIASVLLPVLVASHVFAQSATAPMSVSDAFNAGAAAGAGTKTIHDTITSGSSSSYSPQNVVSSYSTTTPSQSSYWTGARTGTAGVTAGGNSTIAGCQDTFDPTTATAQCNAINAVINTKSTAPPPMVTKNDPIYTTGKAITNNPTSIVGTVSNYYTGCNTSTTTNPGNVTQDVCTTYASITGPTCAKTETVTVDALYNYQCVTTPFVQSTQTCHKTSNVVVDWVAQCRLGAQIATVSNMTGPGVVTCTGTDKVLSIDFGTIAAQCHGGGCNSDYYDLSLTFMQGTPSSNCRYLSRTYDGNMWNYTCAVYDGSNTISITQNSSVYGACPAGSTLAYGWSIFGTTLSCVANVPPTQTYVGRDSDWNVIYTYACPAPYTVSGDGSSCSVAPSPASVTFSQGWGQYPISTVTWTDQCTQYQ